MWRQNFQVSYLRIYCRRYCWLNYICILLSAVIFPRTDNFVYIRRFANILHRKIQNLIHFCYEPCFFVFMAANHLVYPTVCKEYLFVIIFLKMYQRLKIKLFKKIHYGRHLFKMKYLHKKDYTYNKVFPTEKPSKT